MSDLLTDEEIENAVSETLSFDVGGKERAIAKAQDARTKKGLVEWLEKRATKIGSSGGRFSAVEWDTKDYLEIKVVITPEDWESIKKEVEDG